MYELNPLLLELLEPDSEYSFIDADGESEYRFSINAQNVILIEKFILSDIKERLSFTMFVIEDDFGEETYLLQTIYSNGLVLNDYTTTSDIMSKLVDKINNIITVGYKEMTDKEQCMIRSKKLIENL